MTVIGFTRPTKRLKDSIKEAEDLGFEVIAAPSLDIESGDKEQFDLLESSVSPGVPVIFGSATAAEECAKAYGDRFASIFADTRNIAIGPATVKELAKHGLEITEVPEDYSSFGLVDMLKDSGAARIIAVRSDKGNRILREGLQASGAELIEIASYKLTPVGMNSALFHMMIAIKRGRLDVMAFTSPLSASSFFDDMKKQYGDEKGFEYMTKVKVAAIGKPTAMMLESLGRPADIVPENTTFHDMLLAIKEQA